MNSNENVNPQAEWVLTLTQRQAEILHEELAARRRHYAGQIGWLRGAGRNDERVLLINRAECIDVLKAKINAALVMLPFAVHPKGEQRETNTAD